MKKLLILSSIFILSACNTIAQKEPINWYEQPQSAEQGSIFLGEDSPGKFLRKGHEKIFVCEINKKPIKSASFDTPVAINPGTQLIKICYEEGLNRAMAELKVDVPASSQFKVQLGEHSYLEVNFSIKNTSNGSLFVGKTTIPKAAGTTTILM